MQGGPMTFEGLDARLAQSRCAPFLLALSDGIEEELRLTVAPAVVGEAGSAALPDAEAPAGGNSPVKGSPRCCAPPAPSSPAPPSAMSSALPTACSTRCAANPTVFTAPAKPARDVT